MGNEEERELGRQKDMKQDENLIGRKSSKANYVTEYVFQPARWTVDDPRYDWLTPSDRKYLKEGFDFDYGDLMNACSHFMMPDQIREWLMCDERTLDQYCMVLWRKDWGTIYRALTMAARNEAVDEVFLKYAKRGNASAIAILAHNLVKLDQESQNKALTIQIVNDLGEESASPSQGATSQNTNPDQTPTPTQPTNETQPEADSEEGE